MIPIKQKIKKIIEPDLSLECFERKYMSTKKRLSSRFLQQTEFVQRIEKKMMRNLTLNIQLESILKKKIRKKK